MNELMNDLRFVSWNGLMDFIFEDLGALFGGWQFFKADSVLLHNTFVCHEVITYAQMPAATCHVPDLLRREEMF